MAHIDPTVARILDTAPPNSDDADNEDALLNALENESDEHASALRERRLQQLHAEMARAKMMRDQGATGDYREVKDERAVLDATTQTKLCVVHFFRPDFNRCRILDGHLETLAPKHFDTRFLRINVDNCPFLTERLKIKVLPSLLSFVDGIVVDRIIGFEGIGRGTDAFRTWQLEERLLRSRVLVRVKMERDNKSHQGSSRNALRQNVSQGEDDEGDDWD